jgi:hypothetical protein
LIIGSQSSPLDYWISILDPIIKRGGLRSNNQEGMIEIQESREED